MDEEVDNSELISLSFHKYLAIVVASFVGFGHFWWGVCRMPIELVGCIILFMLQVISLQWTKSLTKLLEILFQPILILFFVATLPLLHMCKAFSDNLNPPQSLSFEEKEFLYNVLHLEILSEQSKQEISPEEEESIRRRSRIRNSNHYDIRFLNKKISLFGNKVDDISVRKELIEDFKVVFGKSFFSLLVLGNNNGFLACTVGDTVYLSNKVEYGPIDHDTILHEFVHRLQFYKHWGGISGFLSVYFAQNLAIFVRTWDPEKSYHYIEAEIEAYSKEQEITKVYEDYYGKPRRKRRNSQLKHFLADIKKREMKKSAKVKKNL